MKFPMYLTEEQIKELKFEVISDDLKIYLTRKLRKWAEEPENIEDILIRKNTLINLSSTIRGGKIYVLEADDMGYYWKQDIAWHEGEFELIFRRLSTIEFIEFVAELIDYKYIRLEEVNLLLEKDNLSFRYNYDDGSLTIKVLPIEEVEKKQQIENLHPNIRVLINRMEKCLEIEDFGGVLHASASIFETLAKDIIGSPSIQNQTLKSFFERYKKDSNLPEPVLNYILEIYDRRNKVPLAGHGSTQLPSLTREEAIVLVEMTKAFVLIEYKLRV